MKTDSRKLLKGTQHDNGFGQCSHACGAIESRSVVRSGKWPLECQRNLHVLIRIVKKVSERDELFFQSFLQSEHAVSLGKCKICKEQGCSNLGFCFGGPKSFVFYIPVSSLMLHEFVLQNISRLYGCHRFLSGSPSPFSFPFIMCAYLLYLLIWFVYLF